MWKIFRFLWSPNLWEFGELLLFAAAKIEEEARENLEFAQDAWKLKRF